MPIKLGILMDPIAQINFHKDSSLAMLWAAQRKGWQLWYMEPQDLFCEDGQAKALMAPLKVKMDANNWFQCGQPQKCQLDELNVILMRKDPPVDNEFIYSTMLLEMAERKGTLVVNKAETLRNHNEKLFATEFPQCCPPLLATKNMDLLRHFHKEHQDVIFKPLDGMGGSQIFRIDAQGINLNVVLEILTKNGSQTIMAQKYIPAIAAGDKRILIIDGEPVPYALARIPTAGETRGNLGAGGKAEGRLLTEQDRWICAQVIPVLKQRGLMFVGLDVIGDYLTEINITSPTCIRQIDEQFDIDIGMQLMAAIEKKLCG